MHWAQNTRTSICSTANSGVKRCPETAVGDFCGRGGSRAAGRGDDVERGVGDMLGGRGGFTQGGDTGRWHGEVTCVPLPGSHSAPGALPGRAAALTETALATDPPLAGGDHRSHLLKLDQRNPAWIKLSFFFIFFPPPHCWFVGFFFFLERERETAYYDCASKNKYILIL